MLNFNPLSLSLVLVIVSLFFVSTPNAQPETSKDSCVVSVNQNQTNTNKVVSSRGLTPEQQSFFESHVSDIVKIEAAPLSNNSLQGVFVADSFYNIKVTLQNGMSTSMIVVRKNDSLQLMPDISTNYANMPKLLDLLNPTFKLKTDDDARKLQDALDVVYPINTMMSNNERVKTFWKNGNKWFFIRGTFFQKLAGFIFTTGPDGTITSISYSLQIEKK